MINTREKNCIKWAWFLLFWHNSIFWFYGYEYIQLCTLVASFYIFIHILFVQLTWNLTDLCPREQIYQIHCLCTVYVVYIHQIGLRLPKIRNTLYQTNEVFLSSFIFFQSFNCTHTHIPQTLKKRFWFWHLYLYVIIAIINLMWTYICVGEIRLCVHMFTFLSVSIHCKFNHSSNIFNENPTS